MEDYDGFTWWKLPKHEREKIYKRMKRGVLLPNEYEQLLTACKKFSHEPEMDQVCAKCSQESYEDCYCAYAVNIDLSKFNLKASVDEITW